MEPQFRNCQINYKFQEKNSEYYCWNLRKKKAKHEIRFSNYSSRLVRASVQSKQAGLQEQ